MGVNSDVLPGTYVLNEQGNDGGTTTGTYSFGTWTCVNADGSTHAFTDPRTIVLANGDNVTCTISNTRQPSVHIVKTAQPSIAGNTHIGQTITPNADGTFTATYVVTVTNGSTYIGDTGPINEWFTVPTGLAWNGTQTASITYNANGTGATLLNPITSATQAQLAASVTLAQSIQDLPAGASVSFTIAIPLRLDLSLTADGAQTVWQANQTTLATCAAHTSAGGNTYTDATAGIPNQVTIADENQTYTDIPTQDNIACVTVNANPQWAVAKYAPDATSADGFTSLPGTTGPAVKVNDDGTVSITYRVRVTNTGNLALPHPAIGDTLTLPTVFTITDVLLGTTSQGTTGTFTIPAGTTAVQPGASVDYLVTVRAQATDLGAVNWTTAGTCSTEGAGTPTAGGFFNLVSLTGDSDGADNNDACVPINPPSKVIHLEKLGVNCDTDQPTCPLLGAEYQIYGTDPSTTGSTPIAGGITVDATNGSRFNSSELPLGEYWIVETKAPDGFSLLPQPIHFTLTVTGIQSPTGAVVSGTGTFTLVVADAPLVDLPTTGGPGTWPFAAIGMALLAAAAIHRIKTSRSDRSRGES